MKSPWLRVLAGLVAAVAAVSAAVCIGLLVVGHYRGVAEDAAGLARVAELSEAVKADGNLARELEAELKRITDASLLREEKAQTLGSFLAVAVVVFLVGAKSVADGRATPSLEAIQRDRILGKNGRTRRARPKKSCGGRCGNGAIDLECVSEAVSRLGSQRSAAIPLLQAIQSHYRYLPEPALRRVCELTEISPAQIAGVASFYPQFRHRPTGEHVIRVCHGTACHVAGAELVADEIRRQLGIPDGEDTDRDLRFTVDRADCLGCCTRAPVVQIDTLTYGPLAIEELSETLDQHETTSLVKADTSSRNGAAPAGRTSQPATEIRIGLGSCCVAGGSDRVHEALRLAAAGAGGEIAVKRVGCVGMCHQTPLVEVVDADGRCSLYTGVGADDARGIVRRHAPARGLGRLPGAARGLLRGENPLGRGSKPVRCGVDPRDPQIAAFVGPQRKIATEHGGVLDPTDCDEYIRHEGFAALRRCVGELIPEQVIAELEASGLRGRGGAGFPLGRKWRTVASQSGGRKFVIANGDEGDPGAFMDRMLMESFPYRIVEGLAIAAYAVGAREGYFYIRREYPLAVERIQEAITECEQRGLIGTSAGRDGVRLELRIAEGASAFVCGEETALIASIEGQRGTPRFRPPFPAESGLWGSPTLVNNVETLANVPWIIRHGSAAYASLGTPRSTGTKVFALAGKIRRGGLIEVPMGVTIRQIVEEIGGGIKNGRRFKAVQIGGPSGGCIPAELADTPVDYEALSEIGAIMGSGGLVVMDDSDCMVDIARYFLAFTQSQSCGRCTPCRVGTRRMLDIVERLCEGRGSRQELEELERLAHAVERSSLCGLGRTAPRPILTTLRYFREEYEAHLAGHCPAAKCRTLTHYRITDACIGCTICAQRCPADAIAYRPYEKHAVMDDRCVRCGMCLASCPENAVEVLSPCPA